MLAFRVGRVQDQELKTGVSYRTYLWHSLEPVHVRPPEGVS